MYPKHYSMYMYMYQIHGGVLPTLTEPELKALKRVSKTFQSLSCLWCWIGRVLKHRGTCCGKTLITRGILLIRKKDHTYTTHTYNIFMPLKNNSVSWQRKFKLHVWERETDRESGRKGKRGKVYIARRALHVINNTSFTKRWRGEF